MRRSTMSAAAMVAALVLALSACGEAEGDEEDETGARGRVAMSGADGPAVETFARYDAAAVPGGPGAGARFSIGRTAARAQIAAMDLDVGPEGAELPAGRGTVAQGATLFAAQCAVCHGKAGEGVAPAFPQLIGRDPKAEQFAFANDPKLPHTIGNYWPYATTLFDYIKRAMPLVAPGSLSDDQVYALSAYLLAANDVIPEGSTLDAAALRLVRMPYRDRFVPDDRKAGPLVNPTVK